MANNSFGFIFMLVLAIIIFFIGLVIRSLKFSILMAGYNILPEKEKEKFDYEALCKYISNLLFILSALIIMSLIGLALNLNWLIYLSVFLIFAVVIASIVYTNSGNRFMK